MHLPLKPSPLPPPPPPILLASSNGVSFPSPSPPPPPHPPLFRRRSSSSSGARVRLPPPLLRAGAAVGRVAQPPRRLVAGGPPGLRRVLRRPRPPRPGPPPPPQPRRRRTRPRPRPRARLLRRERHLPPQLPRTVALCIHGIGALDTGSDLFWVPCDCKQCAPTTSPFNFVFNTYSPSQSSTSKKVPCSSSFCDTRIGCTRANSSCPYSVEYLSENTSSSGVLVEDVLYFTQEDARSQIVEAPVVFGCGQFQTGAFLDGAALNGLFGLGMNKISVPSILSSKGLTSNSFSMCFGSDGVGRINFGDKGSAGQDETPFIMDNSYPQYNISITGLKVGNKTTQAEVYALVDSGTSFTLLADPLYTQLGRAFTSQVKGSRFTVDSSLPFEYCYRLGRNQTTASPFEMGFITKNGSLYPVLQPFVFIVTTRAGPPVAYCLAIVKSSDVNIIGENFMTGLRLVFDRERLVLGWEKFNCYNGTSSSTLPVNRNPSAPAPTPTPAPAASGPSTFTPGAAKPKPNNAQAPGAAPHSSHSSHLNAMANKFLILSLLLVVAIL